MQFSEQIQFNFSEVRVDFCDLTLHKGYQPMGI